MTNQAFKVDQAIIYLKFRYNTPYRKSYLAKRRSVGGGPIYFKIGSTVFYDQIDLDNWILSRRTRKIESSSGLSAQVGLDVYPVETEPLYPDFDDNYIYMD